jgi:ADP-heptose:LPS heptosyltransferase
MLNRIKDIIYNLVGWLARMGPATTHSGKVLIVRVDEIGDYMLWRPLIPELCKAERFTGMQFTLCGNSSWRSLYEQLDADTFDQTVWLDKTRFKQDLFYRYRFLQQIHKKGFSWVINPTYSRDKRNDDAIVKAAAAPDNFGMVANTENWRSYDKGYDRNLYLHCWAGPDTPLFELIRNRKFTEYVTGKNIETIHWQIAEAKLPALSIALPEKFVVIFPGSRSKHRIWPAAYFAEVAQHFQQKDGLAIVVCGGNGDQIYTEAFKEAFAESVTDLTGATRLPELLTILHRAEALVTVDTGSVHLAAAVGCRVLGIYNGSQYGRFSPYPLNLTNKVISIYPTEIEEHLENPTMIQQKYLYTVAIPYQWVQPKQVIELLNHSFHA